MSTDCFFSLELGPVIVAASTTGEHEGQSDDGSKDQDQSTERTSGEHQRSNQSPNTKAMRARSTPPWQSERPLAERTHVSEDHVDTTKRKASPNQTQQHMKRKLDLELQPEQSLLSIEASPLQMQAKSHRTRRVLTINSTTRRRQPGPPSSSSTLASSWESAHAEPEPAQQPLWNGNESPGTVGCGASSTEESRIPAGLGDADVADTYGTDADGTDIDVQIPPGDCTDTARP